MLPKVLLVEWTVGRVRKARATVAQASWGLRW